MPDSWEGRAIEDLLASFSDGIIISDEDSSILWMNSVAERLLGVSTREWRGRRSQALAQARPELAWIFEDEKTEASRCWQALSCNDRNCPLWGGTTEDCWAHASRSASSGEGTEDAGPVRELPEKCSRCQVYKSHTVLREREVLRVPCEKVMLQLSSSIVRNRQGAAVGRLRILRDVTRDRELARLKDDFLSALSHELRTPLTSIRSYAEILLSYPDTDPETQKEFLGVIQAESERLDQMIDDMSELQRLELTRSVWNNQHILFQDVVQSALRDHERALEKRGIRCQVEIDPNAPLLWADFDRLHRVLSTLLRNLQKVTEPGGSILLQAAAVRGKREADRTSLIHVTLSASGAADAQPAQPGALGQADSGSRRISLGHEKSMGLGIILCKQILDQCGGNLWTDNGAEGSGHTIHFILPALGGKARVDPDELRSAGPMAAAIPSKLEKGKRGILVVDDDPSLVNALVFALTKEGYNVHSSTSARRALEMVKQIKPDLIISDITMPEMDGYTFLEELQKEESAKMIPFIFVSARGEPMDRIRGLKTGVDDYLSKPFEIKELAARVEALLARVERLKDLARFDALTGAMTRRAFEEALPRELRKAQLNRLPLAIAMGDLDHFKSVNDTHGHPIGDFVLQSFVRFLQKNLRDDAILVRYGGEEFCIVMPDVKKQVAQEILERIRSMLSETSFRYEKEKLQVQVTCSFGVSGFPEDSGNPEGLIEKADEALYAAKNLGRNRVVVYGEPAAPHPTLKPERPDPAGRP
ncbi:MAG: diguanylate cyclase [bacterium]